MAETINKTTLAFHLLNHADTGILSTHSLDVPGYPFGSVTPYCLDYEGAPIIYISNLAQHTKNIDKNEKVSLTIVEETKDSEKQAYGRFTYLADAKKLSSSDENFEEIRSRYFKFFPKSKEYEKAHGFFFYKLAFIRGRYIGGFGKIFWIEQSDWQNASKSPFSADQENSILEHMNEDHVSSLRKYCHKFKKITCSEDDKPEMIALYRHGFTLLLNDRRLYFPTEQQIENSQDARQVLILMSK